MSNIMRVVLTIIKIIYLFFSNWCHEIYKKSGCYKKEDDQSFGKVHFVNNIMGVGEGEINIKLKDATGFIWK